MTTNNNNEDKYEDEGLDRQQTEKVQCLQKNKALNIQPSDGQLREYGKFSSGSISVKLLTTPEVL
jgi:hypothetical protein